MQLEGYSEGMQGCVFYLWCVCVRFLWSQVFMGDCDPWLYAVYGYLQARMRHWCAYASRLSICKIMLCVYCVLAILPAVSLCALNLCVRMCVCMCESKLLVSPSPETCCVCALLSHHSFTHVVAFIIFCVCCSIAYLHKCTCMLSHGISATGSDTTESKR